MTQLSRSDRCSEKDTNLAHKLAQLQPFITVFSPEIYAWGNLHRVGQPNTFLAPPRRVQFVIGAVKRFPPSTEFRTVTLNETAGSHGL